MSKRSAAGKAYVRSRWAARRAARSRSSRRAKYMKLIGRKGYK